MHRRPAVNQCFIASIIKWRLFGKHDSSSLGFKKLFQEQGNVLVCYLHAAIRSQKIGSLHHNLVRYEILSIYLIGVLRFAETHYQ